MLKYECKETKMLDKLTCYPVNLSTCLLISSMRLILAVIMTQSEFSRVARSNRRHAVKQMFGLSSAFGMFMAVVAIIALTVAIGLVVWFLMVY